MVKVWSVITIVIIGSVAGCVRAGFHRGTDGGDDGGVVVSHDTGQPRDARIDRRSSPTDGQAKLDGSGPGAAPQGCDPGLGWKSCVTLADCQCNGGICYFWCPASELSCHITCSTGSTCTICRMAGGGGTPRVKNSAPPWAAADPTVSGDC
jgi:hypothetical protein